MSNRKPFWTSLALLAFVAAFAASPSLAQSDLPSGAPSLRTKVIGDPAALPIPPDIFDRLLTNEIGRRLSRAPRQENLGRLFAIDGTMHATTSEATWSGCLFFAGDPPGEGSCPFPIAPVTYDGPAAIEVAANRIAEKIMRVVRPRSPVKTLYLGCLPAKPRDATYQLSLMILANNLAHATASLVDVEIVAFKIACSDISLPESSALFDFGARLDENVVVLAPSLTITAKQRRELPSLELPINEGDSLTAMREYDGELSRFFAGIIISELLPDWASAPDNFGAFDDPIVAAHNLRNRGYPKLAETFIGQRRTMMTGTEDVDRYGVGFERGMLLLQRGAFVDAFENLRNVVGRDPNPGSVANSLSAYRALVDAALSSKHYGEAIEAGERALNAPALKAPDASEGAVPLHQRVAEAYTSRAVVCLEGRSGCREGSDKNAYDEMIAWATDDVSNAVRHLAAVSEADAGMASSVSQQANLLVTPVLNAIDIRASTAAGTSARASDLLAELRIGIRLVDRSLEERNDVLSGRAAVFSGVISAPAESELARAADRFRHARTVRNDRLMASGVVKHPLLDFEIAEVLAMRQQFDVALEAALAGEAFLDHSAVKDAYAPMSWEILTALFRGLAAFSTEGQSAAPSTVVEEFRQVLDSHSTLPSLQVILPGAGPIGPLFYWNFDMFHVYACTSFEGQVRKAALAMLDLIAERRAGFTSRVVGCSQAVNP